MTKCIAVVGPMASGKGALVDLLQKEGYQMLSLSDIVRDKTTAWSLPFTRKNFQDVGDKLRQKFGSAILAELIAPKIKTHPEKKYVIDGVRNPAEVLFFKKHFQAFVIGVTASSDKRFYLMQLRHRSSDPTTREEFDHLEARDRGVGQSAFGQQVDACLALADLVIDNNGSLEDFQKNLSYFLKQII